VRKIKEILRLKHACGLSKREIARSCNVARSTVADYLMRVSAVGLSWPEAAELTETQLEARLFSTEHLPSSVHRPPPDCEYIYNHLRCYRNVNLTLTQLWLEYKEKHPDGYQYTQFCEYYRPLAGQAGLLHAPGAPGRREGIHRLLRWPGYRRPGHRRADSHPAIRRRLGRLQLHLCRGDHVPDTAQLD